MTKIITSTILALVCFYQIVLGQEVAITNDPTVKTGVLKNGFRYYLKKNATPAGRATLFLANKVGSILEEDNERGIAHFIEHMNFNGTKHFPKNELISYLELAGVKFGADLNAYTGFNETVYQLPIPTGDPKLWGNAMQIMRDWAADATMSKSEFERERGVIQEERRLRTNTGTKLAEVYRPILYNHSRFAARMPIGTDNVVLSADVSIARNFYKKWYRPDLQALIVVGDIDVNAVEKQIKDLFSDLKPADKPVARPEYKVKLKTEKDFIKLSEAQLGQATIQFYFKKEGFTLTSERDFKRELTEKLTNMLLAKRFQKVYSDDSPAYLGANASISPLIANIDALSMSVVLDPEKVNAGFIGFWTEVERIKRFGFSAEEIRSASDRLARSMEIALSESSNVKSADYAEAYLQHFLKGDAYLTIEERNRLVKLNINAIDTKQIGEYFQEYFSSADQSIIVLSPKAIEDKMPDQQLLNAWISTVEKIEIKPYERQNEPDQLISQSPQPGKMINEDSIPLLGMYHWQLANGMNIYAKPTSFKNNQVQFAAFSKGGTSLYSNADFPTVKNATAFIKSSGLGQFNPSEMESMLNKKAVEVQPYIGDRSEGFEGMSSTADLRTAFEMLYLYHTNPRLDPKIFSRIISQSKSAFRNRTQNPERALADTVTYVLSGYNERRKPTGLEDFDKIKENRIREIFLMRFANPGDFTYVFSGNFNVDSLKNLVCQYLGSLPVGSGKEEAKDLKIRYPKGKIRKDLRGRTINKATVQLVLSGEYNYQEESNLYLDLLQSAIQMRLTSRLREVESGVYSPQVSVSKSKLPINFFVLNISFDCEPGRVEHLIAATNDEISKLSSSGLTHDELRKFVAEQILANDVAMQSNGFWVDYVQSKLEDNGSLPDVLQTKTALKKLTIAEANKFSKKFLNRQNEAIFTLQP
ncbi:insulinase family protein [Pedobacter petrophilus]|uniref:Insulinase family protein n=1 Tax=Pedobacter petrophilus TaxID=1908241 RepID=A0A7K0FW31_9SPHI|nr:M16 family metallopeptidase [Pedobacter petrophilus]MRX75758.1 insulinase family protein [Pedobacter petrophilus]